MAGRLLTETNGRIPKNRIVSPQIYDRDVKKLKCRVLSGYSRLYRLCSGDDAVAEQKTVPGISPLTTG